MNVYTILIKEGVDYCSNPKTNKGGNNLKAYILISTKPGTSLEVVKRIKEKVTEVVAADAIFGRYDAVLILEAPSLESINQVVYKIIEKDPNVIRTETSIVLSPM
jgi:DNA-binding Lrp family transcriptional regulator